MLADLQQQIVLNTPWHIAYLLPYNYNVEKCYQNYPQNFASDNE